MNLQETSKDNHVEDFDHVHLCSLVHGVDPVDVDVLAGGGDVDAVAVVDEGAAGLDLGLELLQRGLVKDDGSVVGAENRRRYRLVTNDNSHVGGAAALLRAVGRHPGDFLVFHEAAVGQDLSH